MQHVTLNGHARDAENPERLNLLIASGGLNLNGQAHLGAHLEAPGGPLIINGNASASCDRLILNGNALLTTESP